MFASPEYEMIFLNNCEGKINATLDLCKKIRKKYETVLKSKLKENERKIYQERYEKNNKDIEYYENSIKYITKRKIEVQKMIDENISY